MLGDGTRILFEPEAQSTREALPVGSLAGDYIVTELLARGGCGSVYRALHATLEHVAAVKVLHASLAAEPKMVERFAREVRVVNLLGHPNIVEIYDVGALPDGRPFYAMEYLSGRTLGDLLHERGRLLPAEVLALFEPVCAALGAAHAAGVVHRDIKPGNIMVLNGLGGPGSSVKLLDFGIAKLLAPAEGLGGLTSEGRRIGTPSIMSPEQLRGGPIDARADVYALGILLFRALTASHPFDAKSPAALANQHLSEPAPLPSERAPLSPALDAIVLRCLEKQPERRYASVDDLFTALQEAVAGLRYRASQTSSVPAMGVAVYLEIRRDVETDEDDEAMSDDLGAILDMGEEALQSHPFVLAISTGSRVLGVRLLSPSPADALLERAEAIKRATSLRHALDERPGADRRVHVNVCVHAGEVTIRKNERIELVGGALMRVDVWAPHEDVTGVWSTREAAEGVPDG